MEPLNRVVKVTPRYPIWGRIRGLLWTTLSRSPGLEIAPAGADAGDIDGRRVAPLSSVRMGQLTWVGAVGAEMPLRASSAEDAPLQPRADE